MLEILMDIVITLMNEFKGKRCFYINSKEATRLALVSGDQPCYAKSIRIMGDIYRKKMEIGNAYRQYESAMNSAYSMGDRLCQIEAMDGAAKCLEILRIRQKICSCRPLDFNNKLLETASKVGAKFLIRVVRIRLCKICESLGDTEQKAEHEREIQLLEEELEMVCGSCNKPFGFEPDSLDVLPCTHILHANCLYDILQRKDKKKSRTCPDCQRLITSKLYLQGGDSPRCSSSIYSINTVPTTALEASSLV